MNKDQATGAVKALAGNVQKITGTLLGNRAQQARGVRTQLAGKAQRLVGDIREVAKDLASKG